MPFLYFFAILLFFFWSLLYLYLSIAESATTGDIARMHAHICVFALYLIYFSSFIPCYLYIMSIVVPSDISNTAWSSVSINSGQLLGHVWLFATPWTAAHQASLSITNSWSLLKLMFTESMMLFNHLTLCRPLLLLPSIFPSIKVFSNESVLHIRWPKYWSLYTPCIHNYI